MAIDGRRITVGTSATLLNAAAATGYDSYSVSLVNRGTVSVDIGGPGVTSGAGVELAAGDTMSVDLSPGEKLYGIVASGTNRVDVITRGA